jgi:hypothetical protein
MTPSAKSMAKIERALKSALAEKAEAVERAKQTLTAA